MPGNGKQFHQYTKRKQEGDRAMADSMNQWFHQVSITETGTLSEKQEADVRLLAETCCRRGHFRLSYPADDGTEEAARHWLAYGDDGMLLAALGLLCYEDSLAECTAFTHPDFRNRGLFSRLFGKALDFCGECDILFPVSGGCPDTSATLRALGAELESEEFQMELLLEEDAFPFAGISGGSDGLALIKSAPGQCGGEPGLAVWQLFNSAAGSRNAGGVPLSDGCGSSRDSCIPTSCGSSQDFRTPTLCGSCQTSRVSDSCACLHHVEVLPDFRRQGYGRRLLGLLFPALYQEGIRRVILQVSGSNGAAIALYKKTGFRITETLSFYLY